MGATAVSLGACGDIGRRMTGGRPDGLPDPVCNTAGAEVTAGGASATVIVSGPAVGRYGPSFSTMPPGDCPAARKPGRPT